MIVENVPTLSLGLQTVGAGGSVSRQKLIATSEGLVAKEAFLIERKKYTARSKLKPLWSSL